MTNLSAVDSSSRASFRVNEFSLCGESLPSCEFPLDGEFSRSFESFLSDEFAAARAGKSSPNFSVKIQVKAPWKIKAAM